MINRRYQHDDDGDQPGDNHRCLRMKPMGYLHSAAAYQRLRRRFRDVCQRTDARCHLCLRRGVDLDLARIDYSATSGPWMFEVDHVKSVEQYPELMMDLNNWSPSHRRCNRMKHTRDIDKDVEYQGGWQVPDW